MPLQPGTLQEKGILGRCFQSNFAKFSRKPCLWNMFLDDRFCTVRLRTFPLF